MVANKSPSNQTSKSIAVDLREVLEQPSITGQKSPQFKDFENAESNNNVYHVTSNNSPKLDASVVSTSKSELISPSRVVFSLVGVGLASSFACFLLMVFVFSTIRFERESPSEPLLDTPKLGTSEGKETSESSSPSAKIDLLASLLDSSSDDWNRILASSKLYSDIVFWVIANPTFSETSAKNWISNHQSVVDAQDANLRILGYVSLIDAAGEVKDTEVLIEHVRSSWGTSESLWVKGLFLDNFGQVPPPKRQSIVSELRKEFGASITVFGAFGSPKSGHDDLYTNELETDYYCMQKSPTIDCNGIRYRIENTTNANNKLAGIYYGMAENEFHEMLSQWENIGLGVLSISDDVPNATEYDKHLPLPSYWEKLCEAVSERNEGKPGNKPLHPKFKKTLSANEKVAIANCRQILRACQLEDGAFIVKRNGNQPSSSIWIQPYFANHAAMALLIANEEDDSPSPGDWDRVERWLKWLVDNQASEGFWYDFEGNANEYRSNGNINACDSSAALFLLVAERYTRTSRKLSPETLFAARKALRCIQSLQDPSDGLTWAKPGKSGVKIKYLLNNVETYGGLKAAEKIFNDAGLKAETSQCKEMAIQIGSELAKYWREEEQLYAFALHSNGHYDTSLNELNTYGLAQLIGNSFIRPEPSSWGRTTTKFKPDKDGKSVTGPERWLPAAVNFKIPSSESWRSKVIDSAILFEPQSVYMHRPSLAILAILDEAKWLPKVRD